MDDGRAPSGQALAATPSSPQAVSPLTGFDPSREAFGLTKHMRAAILSIGSFDFKVGGGGVAYALTKRELAEYVPIEGVAHRNELALTEKGLAVRALLEARRTKQTRRAGDA